MGEAWHRAAPAAVFPRTAREASPATGRGHPHRPLPDLPPAEASGFGPTRIPQWTTPDAVGLAMDAAPQVAVVIHGAPSRS